MSMTVTVNEAGLVALPESVLAMFGITGAQQIELDVEGDGVKLRLGYTNEGGDVTAREIVSTINGNREERANDKNTFWDADATALLKRTSHFRLGVMPTREERNER